MSTCTNTVSTLPGYYTADQVNEASAAFFKENGYLVITDALSDAEVDELNGEAVKICRGIHGKSAGTAALLPQFGEATDMSDDEVIRHYLCIHFPHKVSEIMRRYLAHKNLVRVLVSVIGPDVKCMQSMLFIKAAGKPGQAWHQDEDYIPTRDRSLTGAWMALDDATVDNGCLWVIPGSHRHGILWPQYPQNDKRFDCAEESYDFPYTDADSIPVEVPRGAIVYFNGYLLHRSLPNRKQSGFRRVLVNHYMSAQSFLPWQVDVSVPQAKNDFRDIIMVAGRDPYAWKGTVSVSEMHVRPDGKGGCGDGRMSLDEFKAAQASAR
ncbi:MAG: phytanoyl-CoA dioxygenase family protein [Verrucomicrobiota bacterium]|nr:phytanoyl-CoA dioxygenase family protein [Verrucomicrobiota bacterium]